MLDLDKIENIELDDIHMYDYPDFVDAFISYAEIDGVPLTDEQLDYINDKHRDFVYDQVMKRLY